jgi:two-component system sensor histidine kinase PhoQ
MAVNAHYSLRKRLLIICSVVIVSFVSLLALVLDQAFKQSLSTDLQDRLQTHMYMLLGSAEFESDGLSLPQQLDVPLFNQIDSGVFAVINNPEGNELWRSLSAQSFSTQLMSSKNYLLSPGIIIQGEVIINEQDYFYTSLGVAWEREDKSVIHSTFSIAESTLRFNSVLHQYRLYLWIGLIMLTVILLVAFALTLYWGLLPLNYLADDLLAIESGKKDRLEGNYPLELSGLANNLNELIEHEKRQHTRYRNTLGNLAHSLKTPLAVLRGMVDQQMHASTSTKPLPVDADLLGQQVSRMDEIVQHQLQRAVHVGPQSLHKTVALAPLVSRLENVIKKVYLDKITRIDIDIPADTVFRGDEGDLMEIIGNLMDNAGKYGNGRLRVSAKNIVVSQQSLCCISVEDDGVGIASDKISDVLRRGVRADERHQGQGIGLAVVIDIVDQYQGKLSIKPSPLGGACIELLI